MNAIRTGRLCLAPVAASDQPALSRLLHRPEVRRYLCDDTLVPRATVAGWIAESCDPASGTCYWRIAAVDEDLIGLVGLRPPSAPTLALRAIGWRSRELVIALDPEHWGRGFATEAVDAIVAHGLSDGVTFAIIGAVDLPNERSHKLMARCGFAELGRIAGPLHPLVVYERSV
jgi:[ribosomal protein S5]-alanine N-acetyltransferase